MPNFVEHLQSTFGAVGLKVSVSSILDLADPDFSRIPEEIKAAAFLAAKQQGWTKEGLKMVSKSIMGKRYDEDTGNFVILELEDAAKKHPNVLDFKEKT